MNIEQKIRVLWGNSEVLKLQLPLKNLTAGFTVCTEPPYGVIREKAYSRSFMTNAGPKMISTEAEIEIHVTKCTAAEIIRETCRTVFCVSNHFRITAESAECLAQDHWKVTLNVLAQEEGT